MIKESYNSPKSSPKILYTSLLHAIPKFDDYQCICWKVTTDDFFF